MAGAILSRRRTGAVLFIALGALILAARAWTLRYDHSLHSIDGVLQTWFALHNFAAGKAVGSGFQSYLGVTMPLALVPVFVALGSTLYASTVAATAASIAGAFASAWFVAWALRPIARGQRAGVAVLLVFGFYFALAWTGRLAGYPYPLDFDPGVSLRSVRGFLPVFTAPAFIWAVRAILRRGSAAPGMALGLVAGAGLLWSNDAGVPLVIALAAGLVVALPHRPVLLARVLALFALGTAISASAIVLAVTQGEPGPWLRYNFSDVAGDQFWYFGPWARESRVLGIADLRFILTGGNLLSGATLLSLIAGVCYTAIRRLRGRGSPVRGAAFVFVGASTVGTALVPQIGGHVAGGYSDITILLGACAPLIAFQRPLLRLARPIAANAKVLIPVATVAAAAMLASEGVRAASITNGSDRTHFARTLGFYVTPQTGRDLRAIEKLARHWNTLGFPQDRRLLSVYTSALDIAAGVESPTPVGSLIHALGDRNRAAFTALVAQGKVAAVTTIAPDYSGWEGWNLRANAAFFAALRSRYSPIGRTDQHVLWVRGEQPALPTVDTRCSVTALSKSSFAIDMVAGASGLAAITLWRTPPFAQARSAVLTATEDSPFTRAAREAAWEDFPRYGLPNRAQIHLAAPVEPGERTRLTLAVMDGSPIGSARCSAHVLPAIDFAAIPDLPDGIHAYLGEAAP